MSSQGHFIEQGQGAIPEPKNYGVLLYYKYTTSTIPDLQDLLDFYSSSCTSLSLLGRVRISPNGVNVTVGGELGALEKHIEAVKENSLFDGTDFKLASCQQPLNNQVARECGFTSLSIRIVKELVTLSPYPLLESLEISKAGRHLSAVEFHSVLQDAGKPQEACNAISDKKIVLLDARNLYETRIGKFQTQNVETLDPGIRQYSDLPKWIDDNSERLRGIALEESDVRWPQPISGLKVLVSKMYISYSAGSSGTWSNFPMGVSSKARILFLTTGCPLGV